MYICSYSMVMYYIVLERKEVIQPPRAVTPKHYSQEYIRVLNIVVTMPTRDVLLRHFCKMALTVGIRGCTLLSLLNSCCSLLCKNVYTECVRTSTQSV